MKLKLNLKRTMVGSVLLLILAGEPTVAAFNGLLSIGGLIALLGLYVTVFLVLDSLRARYRFSWLELVLAQFVLYSVLVTGFLHAEIANYVLTPQDSLITTLIRLQASCFGVYAFALLDRLYPREITTRNKPRIETSIYMFIGYTILLTPSGTYGLSRLIETFTVAPTHVVPYLAATTIALGVLSWRIYHTPRRLPTPEKQLTIAGIGFFSLSLIPHPAAFIVSVITMPPVTYYFLRRATKRKRRRISK